MSTELKSKQRGAVLGAYTSWLSAFVIFAGMAFFACDLFYPILFLSLLYVSVTFGFVYRYRVAIKNSLIKSLLVFVFCVGLTLLPFKWVLNDYFYSVLMLEFIATSATFSYTYGFKCKIEKSPWQYIFPIFLIFLFIMTALMILL